MSKNSNNANNATDMDLLKQISEHPDKISPDMINQFVQKVKGGQIKKTVKFDSGAAPTQAYENKQLKSAIKSKPTELVEGDFEDVDQNKGDDAHSGEEIVPSTTDASSALLTIMGFSLPKTTLYLIIFCIVVSIALYYMTSKPEKENKKKKSKHNKKSSHSEED